MRRNANRIQTTIGAVLILITLVLIFLYFAQELPTHTEILEGICQTSH